MGGIIGGIFGGGNSGAQQEQQASLARAQDAYQAYRPEAMQSRLNALSNISTAYQGANNALETMYGAPPKAEPSQFVAGGKLSIPRSDFQAAPQELPPPPGPPPNGRAQGTDWIGLAEGILDPGGFLRGMFF